jgi:hypothetical protein
LAVVDTVSLNAFTGKVFLDHSVFDTVLGFRFGVRSFVTASGRTTLVVTSSFSNFGVSVLASPRTPRVAVIGATVFYEMIFTRVVVPISVAASSGATAVGVVVKSVNTVSYTVFIYISTGVAIIESAVFSFILPISTGVIPVDIAVSTFFFGIGSATARRAIATIKTTITSIRRSPTIRSFITTTFSISTISRTGTGYAFSTKTSIQITAGVITNTHTSGSVTHIVCLAFITI